MFSWRHPPNLSARGDPKDNPTQIQGVVTKYMYTFLNSVALRQNESNSGRRRLEVTLTARRFLRGRVACNFSFSVDQGASGPRALERISYPVEGFGEGDRRLGRRNVSQQCNHH